MFYYYLLIFIGGDAVYLSEVNCTVPGPQCTHRYTLWAETSTHWSFRSVLRLNSRARTERKDYNHGKQPGFRFNGIYKMPNKTRQKLYFADT